MKITGTRSYVKFDMENGYILKVEGELMMNQQFIVYKNIMKHWEPPHHMEQILLLEIDQIIQAAIQKNENSIVKLNYV